MSPLSKVTLFLLGTLLVTFPITGVADEVFEIATGGKSSASWEFTRQLSTVWRTVHQKNEQRFAPRYAKSIEERLELLRTRQVRFAIGPINALSPQLSKKSHIKVASLLWRVYLATIVSAESDVEVGLTTYQRWLYRRVL